MKKILFLTINIAIFFFWILPSSGAMTGGDYEIYADSIGFVGSQISLGGDFTLYDTGGEFFATSTGSGAYILNGGFQALEKGILSFSLSSDSLNLGDLSLDAVSSGSITATVSTDSQYGYSVSIIENGNLCSPSVVVCANSIDDVSDGTVTSGVEEYGIRTSGTSGQSNSRDTAINGTVIVASANGPVESQETEVTFKAAIGQRSSFQGSYSHTVTFTLSVNP